MLPILADTGLTLLTTLFVFICFLLVIVILVQKPTGGGLVGAFGGAGGVQDFLGAKMGSKITWFTVVLFASFVVLACVLTVVAKPAYLKPEVPATAPAAPEKSGAGTSDETPATAPTEKTP